MDPRPAAGSPALDPANVKSTSDSAYRNVGFVGAMGSYNWIADWTGLGAYHVITSAGSRRVEMSVEGAPEIVFGLAGSTLQMEIATQNGKSYQLQSATVLTGSPNDWSNEGTAVAGDGTTKSFDQSIGATGDKYFRIQVN